jgi:predicted lipid-binding transport protein (Tim44 family)
MTTMKKMFISLLLALAAAASAAQPAPAPAQPTEAVSGLGALFVAMGVSAETANLLGMVLMVLLVALAVLLVYRMVRSKDTPVNSPFADGGSGKKPTPTPVAKGGYPSAKKNPAQLPNFDANAFLTESKTTFTRLQQVWDKGDLDGLRSLTTPQVFAEMSQQIVQSGAQGEVTVVASINAELLGIEPVGLDYLASVKLTGMLRTGAGAAQPFAEVWNMSRPGASDGQWSIAGIQQLS